MIEFGNELLEELNQDNIKNCQYPWIGTNSTDTHPDADCKPVEPTPEECVSASRSYGGLPGYRNCPDERNVIFGEICKFSNTSYRVSSNMNLHLHCDPSVCKNEPVSVGAVHPKLGVLPDMEQWVVARDQQQLVTILNAMIKDMMLFQIDFLFLGCKVKKKLVKQVLILPPLLRTRSEEALKDTANAAKDTANAPKDTANLSLLKPNINILVLDSVSREHFFRKLPATVKSLEEINKNDSVKASLLDFELFQSLAPRTFPNMRAFFSGEVDKDTEDTDHSYNIETLLGKYINNGYQTMLQEDSCWFDSWGALITDNIHDLTSMTSAEAFMQRWSQLNKKLRSMQVNNFGLTHLSCDVLLKYGVTNQFNNPPKVCFNGKYLTSYFLRYLNMHFVETGRRETLKPMFLYTHLNTGHEKTGKRIAHIDDDLSSFVRLMAKQDQTITIILSDHGPKTTQFGRENARGRYELAHGVMFMIVPDALQSSLGNTYDAMLLNQKRLITLQDVHFTLNGLIDGVRDGLMLPIASDRGCKDLPMYSFTQCLCAGWNRRLPESDRSVAWVAELAIGFLNNIIQFMFKSGNPTRTGGYGSCERLIGKRFANIQTRKEGNKIIYNFDIIVFRYRGEEMFEFAISEQRDGTGSVGLLKVAQWRRVSIYQHFRKCLDHGVKPELCVCRPESSGSNPGRDLTNLLSSRFFGVRTKTNFIDSRCLALLVRTRLRSHRAYEVTNLCSDRVYSIHFDLERAVVERRSISVATLLPVNITVHPWTTHFLTSVSFAKVRQEDLDDIGNLEVVKFSVV